MAIRGDHVCILAILVTLHLIPFAFCGDSEQIPADKGQLEAWFQKNIKPLASRKASIDPALVAAEANPIILHVSKDGKAKFNTITAALSSVQPNTNRRLIVKIGPGEYKERIKISRERKFVTLVGEDPNNKPVLISGGTAKQFGTWYCATMTIEAEYFSAVNIRFENSAPRPNGGNGQQAVAVRIGGDKASFYNCMFIGFQDTLCDDVGRHFYKNCYIEGTVDFIFGPGRSLFVDCLIRIIPGDGIAFLAAQGGESKLSSTGYSFVHCKVTGGKGGTGYLGRAWRSAPQVVFSYSYLSGAVNKEGWSNNNNPAADKTVYYGEYKNTGPTADLKGRYKYLKKLDGMQAKEFITLAYIQASKWLLPPPNV